MKAVTFDEAKAARAQAAKTQKKRDDARFMGLFRKYIYQKRKGCK